MLCNYAHFVIKSIVAIVKYIRIVPERVTIQTKLYPTLIMDVSSGVTGGGGGKGAECPLPSRFLTEKFLLTCREKEARKKGKRGEN